MKISINLLPSEITAEQLKRVKFYKIQVIGVVTVLLLIFLTSLTLALRILQGRSINLAKAELAQLEQRISDLKDTQASLTVIKDRLTAINQYWGVSSKQASMYKLIDKLIPSSVVVTGITIDKNGGAVVSVVVPDSDTLEDLIQSLISRERSEDKISQLAVDSLNRGRDGFFRASFKIKSN